MAAVWTPPALAEPSACDRPDAVVRAANGGPLSPVRSRTQSRSDTFAQQAVEDAVARERARVARELHDGIATELAGAISLFKLYLEKQKGVPDENLRNVFEILERSLTKVRESLAELRPAGISADGLVEDLRRQADEFARVYGIRVELSSNGGE